MPEADTSTPPVFTAAQFQRAPDFCGRWPSEICLDLYRRQGQRPWRAGVLCPTAAEGLLDFADAADLETWLGRAMAGDAG